MNTEEKILNYMDGTLSEEESGELLHSLSVSPEKRVVLEQHIKLRDLTSLAQKPVSVPQALESRMAERFPAIASYNRELSGGMIFEEERQGFFGRMAASVLALITEYPARTGFAVAAASLIAYFSLSTAPKQMPSPATLSQAPQPSFVQNIPETRSNPLAGAKESRSSTSIGIHKTFAKRIPASNITEKATAEEETSTAIPVPGDDKKTEHDSQKQETLNNTPKGLQLPIAQNNAANDANIGNHGGNNPLKNHSETAGNYPFVFRAYAGGMQSLVNIHLNDPTVAAHNEITYMLGVDYILTPNLAIGIEGGQASFSQLITQSSLQSDGPLSRIVTTNSVSTATQWYGRFMARYIFNPNDALRYEFSLGAGTAFTSQLSPVVSGALLLEKDFAAHLAFSGGLGWSGTWSNPNAVTSQISTPQTAAVGYLTVNHSTSTLFTPSYSIRIGLKYRPW